MSTPDDACDECGHFHSRKIQCWKHPQHAVALCADEDCEHFRAWYRDQQADQAHDEKGAP